MENQNRLIALADWPRFHAWPPVGGLRHLRFNQSAKGFSGAFVKIGRRVLVDEQKFFECIEKNQEANNHA